MIDPNTGITGTGDWWSQNMPPPQMVGNQYAINPGVTNPAGSVYQPSGGAQDWANKQNWTQADIAAYGKSRGVENFDPGGYWMSKWPELQARGQELGDPNYAFMRLSKADEFTAPGARYGAGTAGAGGIGANPAAGRFSPVDPYQAPNFVPPTGLDFMNDPGYKARMQMGADAIENSAAARGGILSGGTLKALERYGQDYGTNEFGNVFNRGLQTAGYNAGIGQMGYGNRYGAYQDWQNWLQRNQDRGVTAAQGGYRPSPG